jgi:hypothetical protein
MQPDLLQQLKDIHLPPDPTWWPPAPGWWLLALVAAAGLYYAIQFLRQAIERRRPIRRARAIYQELYSSYEKGLIDERTYLHQANELLKRLLIHGLHEDRARKANDAAWLALLDERAGLLDERARTAGDGFTEGPGQQLGNQRFSAAPAADPEALHPLLTRFFREVRP